MRFRTFSLALVILLSSAAAEAADELALKRLLLSTGGVGYFEFEAEVEGDAELSLDLRLDQVDDVLKSVVVFDDRGGVGGISLPGRQPLAQIFRDLPFDRHALNSPVTLLNALQGAEVTVEGVRPLSGRILQVLPEQMVLPDRAVVTRHRISLMTSTGLRQFILEEADSVRFSEPELDAQVGRALSALATHRVQDRRRLVIQSRGEGRRLVRVGYVVATPLWKASYRLTLPADPAGLEGLLQGWAVIENLSGQDWRDVELTLASGNPVTFRQALYQAYFVARPEVPVEVLGRVLPKLDQGAMAMTETEEQPQRKAERRRRVGRASSMLKEAPAEALADKAVGAGALMRPPQPPPPGTLTAGAQAVTAEEATTQVVFRFPEPVSVASGHSLVVPIADRTMPAERLALYQPRTQPRHPLSAVRLENDGESGLPPGVLTLYERNEGGAISYVGDARMGPLPAGEKRLLSFAVDNKTKIDRESSSISRFDKGRISRGVFRFTRIEQRSTIYRIAAAGPGDAARAAGAPDQARLEVGCAHGRRHRADAQPLPARPCPRGRRDQEPDGPHGTPGDAEPQADRHVARADRRLCPGAGARPGAQGGVREDGRAEGGDRRGPAQSGGAREAPPRDLRGPAPDPRQPGPGAPGQRHLPALSRQAEHPGERARRPGRDDHGRPRPPRRGHQGPRRLCR